MRNSNPTSKACLVEGCERPSYHGPYCNMHRIRLRRKGNIGSIAPLKERSVGNCRIDGCERLARKKGFCETHYARARIHGDPGEAALLRREDLVCKMDGCNRPHSAKGYCALHYDRFRVKGDPGPVYKLHFDWNIDLQTQLKQRTLYNEKTGCLEWIGYKDSLGYGYTYIQQKRQSRKVRLGITSWTYSCRHVYMPPLR